MKTNEIFKKFIKLRRRERELEQKLKETMDEVNENLKEIEAVLDEKSSIEYKNN